MGGAASKARKRKKKEEEELRRQRLLYEEAERRRLAEELERERLAQARLEEDRLLRRMKTEDRRRRLAEERADAVNQAPTESELAAQAARDARRRVELEDALLLRRGESVVHVAERIARPHLDAAARKGPTAVAGVQGLHFPTAEIGGGGVVLER